VTHIKKCEKEWKKSSYRDERVWFHMFSNTLDNTTHKLYNIEEASGHTFEWNKLKNKLLKYFEFNPKEALLQEATREIKTFLGKRSPEKIQEK
jgi:hypothetical protein